MSAAAVRPRPVVLCILDGWGCSDSPEHNAIARARTPNLGRLKSMFPHSTLETSGLAVGLPEGQMGNSEVGHMNIGSGRVVMQELPRIDMAVKDGSLAKKQPLADLIAALKRSGGACHLMGLLSPGGVHSHMDHLAALAGIVAGAGVPVRVHAFLDGRDTPPSSAAEYAAQFEQAIAGKGAIRIATVSGRYYAMDRDKRWDRVAKAYDTLVHAKGARCATLGEAIEKSYAGGVTDEFVIPAALGDYAGMNKGDALLVGNFRADRVRQLLSTLRMPEFDGFARGALPEFCAAVGMTEYASTLTPYMQTLFPPESLGNGLGEIVADRRMKQLRIAETEKYAHVTFFFNGGREQEFAGEERILVPSPKVATYDLQPEMSAREVTDHLVDAINDGRFDFIAVNYANTVMVGHTGIEAAAIQAVEAVDHCIGRLWEAVERAGGLLAITADHGNAEQMCDPDSGGPHTAHTTNPVPFLLCGNAAKGLRLNHGKLADIAPTLLTLMHLPIPPEMTGDVLILPSPRRGEDGRGA
ncbi:MAG: 2,3-bisphosphoglycerate-independent phosphoglycerate mutase [Alphaproteobacteria bacterium]|nr:2,3-bisphosphoglycerate-independent phosphoglycerate mutase [Alphaproteobacteria bacterium]